jgi:hypothetical protein
MIWSDNSPVRGGVSGLILIQQLTPFVYAELLLKCSTGIIIEDGREIFDTRLYFQVQFFLFIYRTSTPRDITI